MSKEVKRYDPFGYDGLSALMHEDVLGDYVRHEDYEDLLAERDAQQWISVEDRLPDSGLCVLAYYTNSHGKGRRIRAEYVAPKSREVEWEYADPDTQCVEHDEESDSFYLTAGWYELIDNWEEYTSIAVVEGEVTHWMPLPAAPIALQGEQP